LKKSMTRPLPLSLPENAYLKSAVLFFPLYRHEDITRSSDLSCIHRRKFPHFPGISCQSTTAAFLFSTSVKASRMRYSALLYLPCQSGSDPFPPNFGGTIKSSVWKNTAKWWIFT
jgi:hypothetical protein